MVYEQMAEFIFYFIKKNKLPVKYSDNMSSIIRLKSFNSIFGLKYANFQRFCILLRISCLQNIYLFSYRNNYKKRWFSPVFEVKTTYIVGQSKLLTSPKYITYITQVYNLHYPSI